MARIIEETWRTRPTLAGWYEFPRDGSGQVQYRGPHGPEYLRALRHHAAACGVTILDHAPALELLLHADGQVAGAAGLLTRSRDGQGEWVARSGTVILATGRCAFRSHLLGAANNTATACWCTAAALARRESRALHRRVDAPARDPGFEARLVVGGLDQLRVDRAAAAPSSRPRSNCFSLAGARHARPASRWARATSSPGQRLRPSSVFDRGPAGAAAQPPTVARADDCQTCLLCELYLCELYWAADALYVHPDCEQRVALDPQAVRASGLLGQFRRQSGWDEWAAAHPNLHWRMGELFARARGG